MFAFKSLQRNFQKQINPLFAQLQSQTMDITFLLNKQLWLCYFHYFVMLFFECI